jgi:hydroxymethylpyrimidine kinase/phosphomethylpyrimidine kinase
MQSKTKKSKISSPPVALTIAGLDPSGGAGIIADIKTFTAFDCFATSAVTSLTFQNTQGVYGAIHQTAENVRSQVLPIVDDFKIASMKTGMLPTREVIEEIVSLIKEMKLPSPVVDPVVRSTSGYDLIDDEALRALVMKLFPLARIVTPNIPEVERITGFKINSIKDMESAAKIMRSLGARAALIKGGHLGSRQSAAGSKKKVEDEAIDVLDDDGQVIVLRAERINTTSTHGTGCTLSAAIAACLAQGMKLQDSVALAKKFVTEAIRTAPKLGHGSGPINHNVKVRSAELKKDYSALHTNLQS